MFSCVIGRVSKAVSCSGMRRDRGSYRGSQPRRVVRFSSRGGANGSRRGLHEVGETELHRSTLTPEQLIGLIMEAEPPEIYLLRDMNKPLTEASVMMSLTNLADKELVHMISWAKKIPGQCWSGQCVRVYVCVCVCVCVCICVCKRERI